jgi:ribosomal protein S18 acetylase RimI-like enzyme
MPSSRPRPADAFAPRVLQGTFTIQSRIAARRTRGAGGASSWPLTSSLQLLPAAAGRPLPDAVLQRMESAFRASFSDVRVHVDPEASRIGALAFTVGSSIYFANGQYRPETMQGQRLLAHELTHVLQQRAGRVKNAFGTGVAVVADPALEAEADQLGAAAAAHMMAAGGRANEMRPSWHLAGASAGLVQPKVQAPTPFTLSRTPLAGSAYRVTVATRGTVVGSVDVRPRGAAAELVNLAVQPQHRQHGAGAALLQEAARTASQRGLSRVTLTASDTGSGRLVHWYRRLGFVPTGAGVTSRTTMSANARTLQQLRMPHIVAPMASPTQIKPAARRMAVIQRMDSAAMEVEPTVATQSTDVDIDPLLTWLKANDPGKQKSNFSVGVTTTGSLIISKVGGLGSGAAIVVELRKELKKSYSGRTVYLAAAFNTAYSSGNHAEMCVVAAAAAMGATLRRVRCTHPNCRYCAATLAHLGIGGGSITEGQPSNQATWAHPIISGAFGTQFGAGESDSVEALKTYNKSGYKSKPSRDCGNCGDSRVSGSYEKLE